MEAKVDVRKLQVLNDRINQTIDALNQVRLSVHGLGHTGGFMSQGFPQTQWGGHLDGGEEQRGRVRPSRDRQQDGSPRSSQAAVGLAYPLEEGLAGRLTSGAHVPPEGDGITAGFYLTLARLKALERRLIMRK